MKKTEIKAYVFGDFEELEILFLKKAIKFNYEGGQVKNINEENRENRVFDDFSEGVGCQIL